MDAARSGLVRALAWLHGGPEQSPGAAGTQPSWRRVLPVALLGLVAAALVVASRIGLPQDVDPLAPFVIGYSWGMDSALATQGASIAAGSSPYGYDGQWFLGQAHDPLLRSEVATTFDSPRYRSLRVLMPAAGWLLAAGQAAAIPYALLAVEILAVALGCAACARIVAGHGRSRWWGLLFALVPGVLVGVGYGTAEPVGLALAVLGLSLTLDRRYAWAGMAFAGAALTKENYLVFAGVAAVYVAVDAYLRGRAWLRPAGWLLAPGAATLAAWWLYVARALPPDSDQNNPLRVFTAPLVGWWEVTGTIARGAYVPDFPIYWGGGVVIIGTFVLLVVALVLALRWRRSLLSYCVVVWGVYGLVISGLLLGRFLSAQRALAPVVLVAGLLVVVVGASVRPARVRPVARASVADGDG